MQEDKTLTNLIDFAASRTLLGVLGDLVHALQAERGAAALFLDSNGDVFSDEFAERRTRSDTAFDRYKTVLDRLIREGTLPRAIMMRHQGLLSRKEELDELRKDILSHKVRYTAAINVYSFRLHLPLIESMVEVAHQTKGHHSRLVSAYSNFLHWKEKLGMERALGTRGFYAHAFRNTEFYDRMIALLAEQKTYYTGFISLASPQQVDLVESLNEDKSMQEVERMNALLEGSASPAEIETYTAEDWFDLMSRTISRLHKIENALVETLSSEAQEKALAENRTAHNTSDRVSAYKGFVRSLKLFSDVSDDDLEALLHESELRRFRKGKLLILEGEPVSRLYIILQGWIKIFNGSESGQEAVLQMVTAGDTLMETAVLLSSSSPVSAQIVEDAQLLSFPAPLIRKFIRNNSSFALSMLNSLSLKSQVLVRQLETSRLKSAPERVGWFLLHSYLNQDDQKGFVELPYDKANIASLLDMRPETFSRALKTLRGQGFEIQENRIKMPGKHALCQFCDAHLAVGCQMAATPDCPANREAV